KGQSYANLLQLEASRGEFLGTTQARWAIITINNDDVETKLKTRFDIEHYLLMQTPYNINLYGTINLQDCSDLSQWPTTPLPQQLLTFLDKLEPGIYFSAGQEIFKKANIKSSNTNICYQGQNLKAMDGINQSGIFKNNNLTIQALNHIK